MEIRQLKHFLAVVDNGSLSVAARKLKMSQGALTTSIKMLERSLSATLFTRTNHGMALNDYGRSLETRARAVLTEIGRAESEIRELQGKERAKVTIGASALFSDNLLPLAVNRFRREHPGIEVTIENMYFDALMPRLRDGSFDYGFFSLSGRRLPRDFSVEVLLRGHRAYVITGAENPLARRRNLKAKDIWPGPWLAVAPPSNFREQFEAAFRAVGLSPPVPAMEYGVHGIVRKLLCSGQYLALISDGLVREEIDAGVLSVLDVPEFHVEYDSGVIFRKDIALTSMAEKLLDAVRVVCAEAKASEEVANRRVKQA